MGTEQSTLNYDAAIDQKIVEVEKQLSSAKLEASSTNASLEASKKEVEKLKERISSCEKVRKDMEIKMGKIMELEKQLSSVKAEALSAKASFEVSEKEIMDLKQHLLAFKNVQQDTEKKLNQVSQQLSSMKSELQSNKAEFERSKEELEEVQDQVSSCIEAIQNMEAESQKVQDQLSLTTTEIETLKIKLKLSKERVIELEKELSMRKKENEELQGPYQNVEDHFNGVKFELESTRTALLSSQTRKEEREKELSMYMKMNDDNVLTIGKLTDEDSRLSFELAEIKKQLDSSIEKVMQLNDLAIGDALLCSAREELQYTKSLLESSRKKAEELKDEYSVCMTACEQTEARKRRLLDFLRLIDSEVEFDSQELDVVEICMSSKDDEEDSMDSDTDNKASEDELSMSSTASEDES